jgi:hypothetical protein
VLAGLDKRDVIEFASPDPKNGIPAKMNRIKPCDPNWSHRIEGIPETYDETERRVAVERGGRRTRDATLSAGVMRLAGRAIPPSLAAQLKGTGLPGSVTCPACSSGNDPAAGSARTAPARSPGCQRPMVITK